jgi:hypothetical protein
MQMQAVAVVMLSETPERQANVGWIGGFAQTSPLMLGVHHAGVRPGESSSRGRPTASCGLQPRLSCLRARMCLPASEAANAWRMGRMVWSQWRSDGRNVQIACEKLAMAMEPGVD